MIDIRKLKELVRLMVANDLSELDLRDSEEQVTLRRHTEVARAAVEAPVIQTIPQPAAAPAPVAVGVGAGGGAVAPPPDDTGLTRIESPMVGTFYSAPNPESGPFVSIGTRVTPDTVICLVEAMKIFNEIKAECSGVVERVAVKNGDAIDFGQLLFLVRPD